MTWDVAILMALWGYYETGNKYKVSSCWCNGKAHHYRVRRA